MLRGLAQRLGYVPRRELTTTRQKLDQLRDQFDTARQQLAEKTIEVKQLRAAVDKLEKNWREEHRRYEALVARFAEAQERRVVQAGQLAAREQDLRDRLSEITAIETRIARTADDVEVARDTLASVEVKLDILEGAANVLDRRLRTLTTPDGNGRTPVGKATDAP